MASIFESKRSVPIIGGEGREKRLKTIREVVQDRPGRGASVNDSGSLAEARENDLVGSAGAKHFWRTPCSKLSHISVFVDRF